jgi:Nif-specific regulatory protein
MLTSTDPENAQRQLTALHEIGQILGSTNDFEAALYSILKIMCDRVGMRRGSLGLLHHEDSEVNIDIAYGLSKSEMKRGRYQIGEGITGRVVASGKPVIVPRISSEPLFLNRTKAIKSNEKEQTSFICVPIMMQKKVVGTLSIDTLYKNDTWLQENVQLLSIVSGMIAQATASRRRTLAERNMLLSENKRLQNQLKERFKPANIIGNSHPMQEACTMIGQVAPSNATVMLRGESGTGKEMFADAIHYSSQRSDKPFIKVHIAALPETLVESELFGHEKGAFTGASTSNAGRFERAEGGTIFLDEIGELPHSVQVKLLRVLQTREIERLGGSQAKKVDVRIITATHVDLEHAVATGTFREDLFYRLNVFPIFVPPLRERKSDVLLLADSFLEKYARQYSIIMKRISTPAIDMMMSYHWPGNVRELENVIERAVILSTDGVVHGHHLPPSLQTAEATGTPLSGNFESMMQAYEREVIIEALKNAHGNMAKAARLLGTTSRICTYRCQRLEISPKQYKG